MIHFESVGTLGNKVLGFGTIGNLSITVLSIACRSCINLQLCPFGFLMGRFRVLQGLVHGIISTCLIKSSTVGESPRVVPVLVDIDTI